MKIAKNYIRTSAGILFYYCGIFYLLKWLNALFNRRLSIITYHRVTDGSLNQICHSLPYLFVTEDTFRKQLSFLMKNYAVINFSDLKNDIKQKLPVNAVIITFDDGYEDNYINAYPILKKHGLSCTMFLATGKIGTSEIPWWDEIYARLHELHMQERNGHCIQLDDQLLSTYTMFKHNASALFEHLNSFSVDAIQSLIKALRKHTKITDTTLLSANRFLNWDQVSTMHDIVEFGTHSHSHTSLDTISPEAVNRELTESKKVLEQKLSKRIITFSYPAGRYTNDIIRSVQACGYSYAVTQDKGVNNQDHCYCLKRINIWEGSSIFPGGKFSKALFALKLSGI